MRIPRLLNLDSQWFNQLLIRFTPGKHAAVTCFPHSEKIEDIRLAVVLVEFCIAERHLKVVIFETAFSLLSDVRNRVSRFKNDAAET